MCFQILGFDVLIDYKLTPFLLEINQCPSFATDSPIDYRIKRGLIVDTLKTLCLNTKRKKAYKNEYKAKIEARIHGGVKIAPPKPNDGEPKVFKEDAKLQHSATTSIAAARGEDGRPALLTKGTVNLDQELLSPSKPKNPAEEERKLKQLLKKQGKEDRDKERRRRQIQRDKDERKTDNMFVLVYPLITAEQEYYIEDNFAAEEKALKAEINAKR